MTGRGIDQILPHPSEPAIHEPHLRDAREYVWLAEQANVPIAQPVPFEYVWGDALATLERFAPHACVVNLETSITRSPNPWRNKEVHYRMNPANAACLAAARVDLCALANNHILDYGRAGLVETLDVLGATGINGAGAGRTLEDAWAPATVSLPSGGRLVVIACGSTSSGVLSEWAATPTHPGVALLPDLSDAAADQLVARMRAAHRPGDLVLVSVHWGPNWGWSVRDDEIRFAHRLIDGGADIVHGHSSHHPRPIELYQGRLILYGCGDFIDDYEGITGYEPYRADLRLMYLATVDSRTGALSSLRLAPMQTIRLQLQRAAAADRDWLRETLARISRPFGTRFETGDEGELLVVVPTPRAARDEPERTVKSVMTALVETIAAHESVEEAARRLRNADVGILSVLDRNTLAGVVTDRDIVLRVVAEGRDPAATAVSDIMTEGVAICSDEDAISTAAAIMVRKSVRRLVVLDRRGHLAGVVSVDDIATLGAGQGAAAAIGIAEPRPSNH
jgi:poly-gamma-glutamate synthesis protein (capsule biosynthesis protein)